MSGNRKPRKAYRPRRADPFAAIARLGSAAAAVSTAPLDADQLVDLGIGYHHALTALRTGAGGWSDANDLAMAANVALLLAEVGIGGEYLPAIRDAQDAIVALLARGQRVGRYVFDGPGLVAVTELLSVHDAQLECEACTSAVMVGVLAEIRRRMADGQVLQAVPA